MIKREIIAYKDPKSPISEVIRALRTSIQFKNNNSNIKTVLITSTMAGEGKSWVSSNLAVTFAQADKKVLILDSDMRRGRQYSTMDVLPTPGLSNYLLKANETKNKPDLSQYIQETEIQNLYVFPAGDVTQKPSELLFSIEMKELLSELKRFFDIIIIDGTPCKLVTDSVILSRIVDSTIIITAYNKTKKEDLDNVIKSINNVSGNIDGIIINQKPIDSKEYSNRYSYSSNEYEEIKAKAMAKAENIELTEDNADSADILKQINEYLETEKNKE